MRKSEVSLFSTDIGKAVPEA